MTTMMEKGMEDMTMTKGNDDRQRDDAERRLTATQRDIRDRNANLPRHVRRSIDRYRVALGMPPLWSLEQTRRRA